MDSISIFKLLKSCFYGTKVQDLRLTDMKYADDVFLLASTAAHVQALIDAMTSYCEDLHTQVSTEKTKVMIIGSDTAESFTCNGQPLEQVIKFKYLGLHFHQSGHISYLITPMIDKVKGARAAVQRKHAQLQCGDTVTLKFCLLQSIVVVKFGAYTALQTDLQKVLAESLRGCT